jgi:hypothetical protein
VGLERGPLSLVTIIEELLQRNSSGSGVEIREYGRRDPSRSSVCHVKMEATCSSETPVDIKETTCRYIPDDRIGLKEVTAAELSRSLTLCETRKMIPVPMTDPHSVPDESS